MGDIVVRKLICLVIGSCLVCALCIAFGFAQDAPVPPKPKPPRDEYKAKAALDKDQVAARIQLALWCLENKLLQEAQEQLRSAAAIDPVNDQLLPAWSKLTDQVPRKEVTITVTLDDGNVVRGKCSPKPFLLKHKFGVLLVPLESLKDLALLEEKGDDILVRITTPEGTFEGVLIAPDLEVVSALGKFTIAFKKVRRFAVEESGKAEASPVPTKPGEVALDWDNNLAQLRTRGLDIVFVFDSTGSMGGILAETKKGITSLMAVVNRLVPNAKLGLVTYRDSKQYDPTDYEFTTKSRPLTQDIKTLVDFLGPIEAYGGGDAPEAIYEGLVDAIGPKMQWRPDAKRIIIVFGDAPPHPENNGLNKLYSLVAQWHKNTGGTLSCIDTGSDGEVMREFKDMAIAGGGSAMHLRDQKEIMHQLVIYIFGANWQKEVEKAYDETLKAPK